MKLNYTLQPDTTRDCAEVKKKLGSGGAGLTCDETIREVAIGDALSFDG
ncbi:hypothetical protein ACFU76_33715 [Streptomyces sp. NPDC057539]